MRWVTSLVLVLAFGPAFTSPAHAILIRPDRDDAEYLELATRYTASLPVGDGEGTLIASRWILTSAAVARQAPKALPFNGKAHEVEAVHVQGDLALLLLRVPVQGIEPAPIYRESDEDGKVVRVVGHGETGKIGGKAAPSDRKRRAGINTVDRVGARTLELRLKPAEDASDLQGAAAPGDRGGPAFIETKEGIFVAGVRTASESAHAEGIAAKIGDAQSYVRVSAFAGWIDATLYEVAAKEAAALMGDADRR
jgi:hypothetical protein